MSRSCSQCGNNGHNSRTCPTEAPPAAAGGAKGIMLFGVRVTEASPSSFRKSVSMNNLSQYDHKAHDSDPVDDGGYASDDVVHASVRNRERKRGTPWTEEEHRLFLTGLHTVGKGDWRGISRNFVKTRTPTQVASHAQKYFLRRTNQNRRRRRSSLFDITPDIPLGSVDASSSKLVCPIPPSRKMADLNLDKAAPEMFPLSMNLPSSSNEQKARGSRASVFETMSNSGDSIMGVSVDLNTFLSSPPISFLSSMVIHRSSSARTYSLISMFLLFYLFFSFYPNLFFHFIPLLLLTFNMYQWRFRVSEESLFLHRKSLIFSFLISFLSYSSLFLDTINKKKVIDVKLRKEEARGKKGSKQNESKQISRKSKVVSGSDASAELLASIQKRQGENNQTNMSEKFNPNEDAALKSVMMRGLNRSPPLSKELMMQRSFVQRESPQLTKFSDSVGARDASHFSIAN
ncbi:hypothetical protein HID58_047076 [Brassica napus]|uniref:Uncharacterized protein n=1 Tax=Brassica napus TaxID=3708 RepID=A0ABQ8AYE0_BRANA|nr:hypothetical protein HID58_047076 [Brassica napus]